MSPLAALEGDLEIAAGQERSGAAPLLPGMTRYLEAMMPGLASGTFSRPVPRKCWSLFIQLHPVWDQGTYLPDGPPYSLHFCLAFGMVSRGGGFLWCPSLAKAHLVATRKTVVFVTAASPQLSKPASATRGFPEKAEDGSS